VGRLIVLDEAMGYAGLGPSREDLLEVDEAAAHVGHAALARLVHVLHVHHGKAAGVPGEISEWVAAALLDPGEVELQGQELRVRVGEEHVVGHAAAEACELEGLIVIRELQTQLPCHRAGAVEQARHALVAIERAPLVRCMPGNGHLAFPAHAGVFQRAAPVALEGLEGHMRGRGGEPALLKRDPHLAWRLPVIAGELDLAVPDGRHPVERALEIPLQGAAHGVELQPDAVERRDRARQRARARAAEARGERGGAPPADADPPDAASGLGLHPVNANVYETLVRLTPDFSVAPQLATRWQLRSRNTWRFHLRQGVRMHDGTTLTAAAVVWTMRRIARAGGGPMGIGQASVRVIDDTTLDI